MVLLFSLSCISFALSKTIFILRICLRCCLYFMSLFVFVD